MSQLDKTFPTNDCAMCTLSPRMVECGSHLNIEKLTYSEVENIEGSPGSFKIRVKKKARSVDAAKCTGCGTCMTGCPVHNKVQIPAALDAAKIESSAKDSATDEHIIDSGSANKQHLIQVLQEANDRYNYLPESVLLEISQKLNIPFAEVYGTASFYKSFSLEPRGKYVIRVCMGTACHVKGGQAVFEEFSRRLELKAEETSKDGMFTLERVNCVGACALGPVVAVAGDIHGQLSPAGVSKIIDRYIKEETE